jgi:hypothetical protein
VVTPPPYTKTLVKNRKTSFLWQVIQEPVFLWLMQILKAKAAAMGVVAACGIFLAR